MLYLKRLHSNSVFVLLFHDIQDFSHKLVSYIINVPATLRENGSREQVMIPFENQDLFNV